MGEQTKPQERCENCGLAMSDNSQKGAWKFFCTNNGKSRRGGDSCKDFWDKKEMKQCLDEMAQLVQKESR